MNEVQRRVVAGAASEMLGRGGKTAVATVSGMSPNTVIKAESEVTVGSEPAGRLRAPGGGAVKSAITTACSSSSRSRAASASVRIRGLGEAYASPAGRSVTNSSHRLVR